MMEIRYNLAIERIAQIKEFQEVNEEFKSYFYEVADFILKIDELSMLLGDLEASRELIKEKTSALYEILSDDAYKGSYLCPAHAVGCLGREFGSILSALYSECVSMIAYVYEFKKEDILIRMELFLELYSAFSYAHVSEEMLPTADSVKSIYSSFAFDYLEHFMEEKVVNQFTVCDNLALDIIMNEDLSDTDYLYRYGEYISDNELKMASYMASLGEDDIDSIARTFTEGYRLGFETTGKDISIKESVSIEYFVGFERVVKRSIELFDELGLHTILHRAEHSFVQGRKLNKRGYYSTNSCKQLDSDHEYDFTLYYNRRYVERKLEAYKKALEKHKEELKYYGGPAVIECFGEQPFCPEDTQGVLKPDKEVSQLMTEYMSRAGELLNEYIKGEERSFTIIAFPTPSIGNKFEEIFNETIRINTLDYVKYRDMQQCLIDTLDKGEVVHIKGRGGNLTDMTVKLYDIKDSQKETKFENCVADVNIPVGEVFTSPKLEGTCGVLHVKDVYLEGMLYHNLKLRFNNGMIEDYSCENYADTEKNQEYIKEHLLFQHETLPLGEFAIGTNTTAYVAIKKYGLESIMPILIAEKTGPHFAVGDTCYSHEEDIVTYNPDGKAIVARQNSISAKRNVNPREAYFNCHTDITIPYDELGSVSVISPDGTSTDIIVDGRFVLDGTQELNVPFDE